MSDRKRGRKRQDPPMLKFTDGSLVKLAVEKLGLRIIGRRRWR